MTLNKNKIISMALIVSMVFSTLGFLITVPNNIINITQDATAFPFTTLVDDNFDWESVGTMPTNWTNKTAGDICQITNNQSVSAPNSLYLQDAGASSKIYFNNSITTRDLYINFSFRFEDIGALPQIQILLYEYNTSAGDEQGYIKLQNGHVYYKDYNNNIYQIGTSIWGADEWINFVWQPDILNQTYGKIVVNGTTVMNKNDWKLLHFPSEGFNSIAILFDDCRVWIDEFTLQGTNVNAPTDTPKSLGLNSALNHEFSNTIGWWLKSGSISTSNGIAELDPSTKIVHNITNAPFYDKLLYVRLKTSNTTGGYCNISLVKDNGAIAYRYWIDYNNATHTASLGTISVEAGNSATTAWTNNTVSTNTYTNDYIELLFHLSVERLEIDAYTRTLGQYEILNYTDATNTGFYNNTHKLIIETSSQAGAKYYFDYITYCRPNIYVIGDSIPAGHNYYDGNEETYPATTPDPLNQSYEYYANLYPYERNNFPVNLAVGSQNTWQIYNTTCTGDPSRGEVIRNRPALVIFHLSNNDYTVMSWQSKQIATQNIVNTMTGQPWNIRVVLAGVLVPNSWHGSYPGIATWSLGINNATNGVLYNITGVVRAIDYMSAIENASGISDYPYMETDGIHPNKTGYERIGNYIQRYFPHFENIYINNSNAQTQELGNPHRITVEVSGPRDAWVNVTWGDGQYTNSTAMSGNTVTLQHEYVNGGTFLANVTVGNLTFTGESPTFDKGNISLTVTAQSLSTQIIQAFETWIPILIIFVLIAIALLYLGISLKGGN